MEKLNQEFLDPECSSLLLESMADGVFVLNSDGEITLWNRAMERITGYSLQEAIGRDCTIVTFSSCLDKTCPTGSTQCGIYQKGAVNSKECWLRHKDGHDIPVLKSARLVKEDGGTVRGIVETVTDLTELNAARQKMEEFRRRLGEIYRLDNIIGKSHPMQQVFSSIKAAANSEATILIQGESGTGKELVASAIHFNSERSANPMVTVNCSALSESLLESELFGHVKGAFTGAMRDRIGRFEEAAGGTIFLDEIGEISPYIQVKLLRVLQEREIERVGDSQKHKIDIRIITATNQDLQQLIAQGKFREDLYYRLKVFPIQVPPLRERKEDIPLLVNHFTEVYKEKTKKPIQGISQPALRTLLDYPWPGNVRELENAIEHAFVLREQDQLELTDLPLEIRQLEPTASNQGYSITSSPKAQPGKKLTRQILLDLLKQCDWNKAEVARRVGISRTAVWKYMKKWDIPLQPAGITSTEGNVTA